MSVSTIKEYVEQIQKENIVQETEVRSKIINPLLNLLKYPSENIAEEYPIYGKDGRKDLNCKRADIIAFKQNNANDYRDKNGIDWVMNNSLVVIELKKPGEKLEDAKYQASFYAMWSRCIIYVTTNGEDIIIYSLQNYIEDKILFNDKIINLEKSWQELNKILNYNNLIKKKNEDNVDIKNEKLIYLEYCKNKINENIGYLTEGINRFLKRDNDLYNICALMNLTLEDSKKIEYKEILNENKALILGNVGVGKTYLLKLIESEILNRYAKEEGNIIPIIITAKGWKKNYFSIEEAIYNLLKYNVPYISMDSIKEKIVNGEYILLIDGIDEIKRERKSFINEIINLSKGINTKIICTCRTNNYFGELDEELKKYILEELTEEQIKEYIEKNIGEHEYYRIYSSDNRQIKELMRNPLLLSMIVFVYKNNNKEIPKNKAILYKAFLENLINLRPKNKNVEIKLDTDKRRKIIQDFACCDFNSDTDMSSIIDKYVGTLTRNEIEEEILDTGIIVKNEYEFDFYHYSFKEYFIAEYIYRQDNKNIYEFINKNIKDKNFYEIITFLVGMCKDEEKQKIIFNELEKQNIELLSKCLDSKYNFSKELEVKEIDLSLKYLILKQLKDSYERVIDENFYELKQLMDPWDKYSAKDIKNFKIGIKGNITDHSLQYHFFILENENKEVIIEENKDNPKIYMKDKDGNNIEIQFGNLQINNPMYPISFYNFKNSKFNIYSYREIAFEYIGKQLKNIVKNNRFPLICKDNILIYEMLEQELKKLPKSLKSEIKISLYENDSRVIYDYLKDKINHSSMLYLMLFFTKNEKNCKNYMLTKSDLNREDLGANLCYQWDLYSNENILKYVSKYYYLSEIAYREIVEEKFYNVKEYMKSYERGPKKFFGYLYKNKNKKHMFEMGTLMSSYKTTNQTVEFPYIKLVEREEPNEKEEELKNLLKEMGKSEIEITTWTSSSMFGYFDKQPLFKKVSKKLEEDLKNIFPDD